MPVKDDFKSRLNQMSSAWEQSQGTYDQIFGGVKIPEANYIAKLQSAKIVESREKKLLMVRREHVIIEGEYKGMIAFDHIHLEIGNGMVFLRRWLEMLGYESPSPKKFGSEIVKLLEQISSESPTVEISVTHSGGNFLNIAVLKLLDEEGQSDDVEGEGEGEGEGEEITVEDLVTFCETEGVDLGNVDTEDFNAVLAEIKEYTFSPESLDENSAALLEALEIASDVIDGYEPKTETETETETENPNTTAIREFCIAQDIPVEDEDDLEIMKEKINEYEYPEEELTAEEIQLLTDNELESCILKPVAKNTATKKTTKKAPTKTTVKAPAKKSTKKTVHRAKS